MLGILVAIVLFMYLVVVHLPDINGVWVADARFMDAHQLTVCRFYITGSIVTVLMGDDREILYDGAYTFTKTISLASLLNPFAQTVQYNASIPDTVFANMHVCVHAKLGQMFIKTKDISLIMYKDNEESMRYATMLAGMLA